MKRFVVCCVALALAATPFVVGMAEDAKLTIKQVMAKTMKNGLCKKAAEGKASDAEKAELVTLFTAMAANKPKKGDEAAFKEKADALVAAATALKEGKDGASAALAKAMNCKTCHDAHK